MQGLTVLVLGLLFSAPSLDDVNRAVKDVLADSKIQTEFPGQDELPPKQPPPRQTRPRRPPPREPATSSGGSAFFSTLLWVLAGVGAVLLAVWLAREFQGYTREEATEEVPATAVPRAPPAPVELENAEALATEGNYEEAVHLLLLHALRSIERDGAIVSSHTSREVIHKAGLDAQARQALMELVGAVELSLFGGRPIDESGYRSSVEHYRRFQAARA